MASYFNSKVSIITKAEIRYEGTIYQINPQQQTIALKEVRSFGTEGRRVDHEIPPSQESYDIIVFKAQDIKEFKQNEEQKQDPSQPQQEKKEVQNVQEVAAPQQQQQVQKPTQVTNSRAFDFEEMLAKMETIEKTKKPEDSKPKYIKTSFFDNLSTSTQKQDRNQKPPQRNQNQIDTDTFGNFYKQNQYKQYKNYNHKNQNRRDQGTKVVYVEKQQQQNQKQQ